MAITWETRVRQPFTFAQVRQSTEMTLGDLLRLEPGEVAVSAIASVRDCVVNGFADAAEASPAHLMTTRAPGGPPADLVLAVRARSTLVTLTVIDIGHEDDSEGGTWCTVTPMRDSLGNVLGIATIIATAELVASQVWDEGQRLSGERIRDPQSIRSQLTLVQKAVTIDAAVNDLLFNASRTAAPD